MMKDASRGGQLLLMELLQLLELMQVLKLLLLVQRCRRSSRARTLKTHVQGSNRDGYCVNANVRRMLQ